MDLQLPEWLQWAILVGGATLAVWLFIVLVVVYQTAGEVSDFIAQERERLGHVPPEQARPVERWDSTH